MLWTCVTCGTKIDPEFDVCWSCGTSADGVPDPGFVTADEAGPIDDPEPKPESGDDPEAELPPPPLDLVVAYQAHDSNEANFLVDQLRTRGIPAVLGGAYTSDLGYSTTSFAPRLMVRAEDLPRARDFLEEYEQRRRERPGRDDE